MVDTSFINYTRDYDCCRYFDLINRIEQFYADGVISDDELSRMSDMRGETLINYQIAGELLHNTPPTDKNYAKLVELVDYLRRCWQLMDYVTNRGILYNRATGNQNSDSVKKKKQKVLHISMQGSTLVSELTTKTGHKEAKKTVHTSTKLSTHKKEKAMSKILAALKLLKRSEINHARHQMMSMEGRKL